MRIEIKAEPPFEDMLEICQNLRERDKAELFATRYGDDPADLARDAVNTGAFRWAVYLDGKPVAAVGAVPRWPKVWSVWAYGTDDWNKVAITLTRHVRRFMIPAIFNAGCIRADCMALASHKDARRWLEYLGASAEKVLDNWGRDGEKFVLYCWTREQTKRIIGKSPG